MAEFEKVLLITDLDGTLLNATHQVSEANKAAIAAFRARGGLFTLASGRMVGGMKHIAEELTVDLPIISYNGGMLYDPVQQDVLYEAMIEDYQSILEDLQSLVSVHEIGVEIYQEGQSFGFGSQEILDISAYKQKVTIAPLVEADLTQPIVKFMIMGRDRSVLEDFERHVHTLGLPVDTVYSEYLYLEILPQGVSKGNALKRLLEYIPHKDLAVIAVGDNLNDLAMLLEADYGFYPENAYQDLVRDDLHPTVHHTEHVVHDIYHNFILPKWAQ
ncbi:hypothetical protein CL176_10435 [Suicoccus acidiformans]|uniref:Haloacid dehalogenase n=1 Tax=Suicoccus acidiformans TaxID=2036206 RepID=A0A347WMR7_9LACT|nr:Cof-type HAD-IIB family hydrolase [Suicoccus acidiformans]AXY26374.1 hypothetical protein CL176_10435 [Suicoccus acidiformans]